MGSPDPHRLNPTGRRAFQMPRTDWLGSIKTQLFCFGPRRNPTSHRRIRLDRPASEVLEPRVLLSVTATSDSYSVLHDHTLSRTAPGVLQNDNAGSGGGSMSAVLVSGPSHASSFTLNSNGSFSYAPSTHWTGSDSFTYYATAGGSNSNTATVSIGVTNNTGSPPLPWTGPEGPQSVVVSVGWCSGRCWPGGS